MLPAVFWGGSTTFRKGDNQYIFSRPDQTIFSTIRSRNWGCSPKNGEKNIWEGRVTAPPLPHELHCQCHANFNRWNCYKEWFLCLCVCTLCISCVNEERGGVQRAQWAARSILLWFISNFLWPKLLYSTLNGKSLVTQLNFMSKIYISPTKITLTLDSPFWTGYFLIKIATESPAITDS